MKIIKIIDFKVNMPLCCVIIFVIFGVISTSPIVSIFFFNFYKPIFRRHNICCNGQICNKWVCTTTSDRKFSVSVWVSVYFKFSVSVEISVQNATENRKTNWNFGTFGIGSNLGFGWSKQLQTKWEEHLTKWKKKVLIQFSFFEENKSKKHIYRIYVWSDKKTWERLWFG